MHACRALERPDCQVFPENMAADSCKALREMVEPLVLASDMACHNDLLDEFASLQSPGGSLPKGYLCNIWP